MLFARRKPRLETERLTLRPPQHSDFRDWTALRLESQDYLVPWEPSWSADHLSRRSFSNRVYWAQRAVNQQSALPLFLIRREAIGALVHHAFERLDLSRIEAACLPENAASRAVLEKSGFKYEGVAQSYLQIDGRWRTHVLYASLRSDRRGRTDAG
jgi:ribosomal-protein-alanine N-acetyltransferase